MELLIECRGTKTLFLDLLTKISIEKQNFIERIQLNETCKKFSTEEEPNNNKFDDDFSKNKFLKNNRLKYNQHCFVKKK